MFIITDGSDKFWSTVVTKLDGDQLGMPLTDHRHDPVHTTVLHQDGNTDRDNSCSQPSQVIESKSPIPFDSHPLMALTSVISKAMKEGVHIANTVHVKGSPESTKSISTKKVATRKARLLFNGPRLAAFKGFIRYIPKRNQVWQNNALVTLCCG